MRFSFKLMAAASLLLICGLSQGQAPKRSFEIDIVRQTFGFDADTPTDVPWDAVMQGCPRRDCIPAIDSPQFVAAAAADFLEADDLVMGIELAGVERAYPTRILNYHEIVNDTLGETPVAVTWCPLCGSGLAFERVLDGKPVEFGVSGLLHNSDLIVYDRDSESLWQQITATAFAGPRRGQTLKTVPVALTTWSEWQAAHPETEVLAPPSDDPRYAARAPYGDYDRSDRLIFPVASASARLHPKEVVHGVEFEGGSFAVTERALRESPTVETVAGDRTLRWTRHANGMVEVVDADGTALVAHRMFWFAWYSFHVDTGLHDRARDDKDTP